MNFDFSSLGKTNLPKITIVTPSYNQGKYLEENILSVLDQNYPNLEYIIIDGGSSDNSLDIIKKYENRITYWKSEKDKGQSDAINKGLHIANGDIIGWLNSDDLLTSGSLFKIADVFQDTSIDIIYSPINMIDANSKLLGISNRYLMDFKVMLFGRQVVNQEGIFWRKKVNEQVGYINISLNYAMDYDYFLRCCMQFTPRFIPYVFASHRKHAAQKTNTTDAYLKEMQMLRLRYQKILGYRNAYFWFKSLYESKRRITTIFGWRSFFKKEWMDL